MKDRVRGIQSIEISGRILNAMVERCEPMMLKELAKAANIAPAQCHTYLVSLKNTGLVQQDTQSGNYMTGPFAMRLGLGWLHTTDLANQMIDSLQSLSEEFGLISLLAVRGRLGPTIVQVNRGASAAGLNIRHGTLFSVTGSSTGRLFAAFDDHPDIQKLIEADLDHPEDGRAVGTQVSRQEFNKMISEIRDAGFATAKGRPIPNTNALAAPVFDGAGKLAMAGTIIGVADKFALDTNSPEFKRLLDLASSLSAGHPSSAN